MHRLTPTNDLIKLANNCNMCGHCCERNSGIFNKEDISKISKHLNISREVIIKRFLEPITVFNTTMHKAKQKDGQCIFYNGSRGCKIHSARPLNCRLTTCKENASDLNIWYLLTTFVNPKDDMSIRDYAFYLKTGGKTLKGFELSTLVKDKEKLKKILRIGGLE